MDKEFNEKLAFVYAAKFSGFERFDSVTRLTGGASQETYCIKFYVKGEQQCHALRRSAGGIVSEVTSEHPGLEVEALLMSAAGESAVPSPQIFYVLKPEDGLGAGFIMQWLEGETLGSRIVRADKYSRLRKNLAFECGVLLSKIHQIDIQKTGLSHVLSAISPEEFVLQTWQRYKDLKTPQPMIDYTAAWLMQNLPNTYTPSLVHNDFRNGNLMVSEERVVAVLDWELAHIGDPMRDLGWICVNSWRFGSQLPVGGFGEYDDLFRGYESASGLQVDKSRVKFWEVFGSFWWAVGCLGMAEHYRNGPDQSVERPAIGRRSSECQIDCVNLLIPGEVKCLAAPVVAEPFMPSSVELMSSVREFLRQDVMSELVGRNQFMARVAANSLDIVIREHELGPERDLQELSGLQKIFNSNEGVDQLRWQLVNKLRESHADQALVLDNALIKQHLRQTVFNQISIDQPKYSGRSAALKSV